MHVLVVEHHLESTGFEREAILCEVGEENCDACNSILVARKVFMVLMAQLYGHFRFCHVVLPKAPPCFVGVGESSCRHSTIVITTQDA